MKKFKMFLLTFSLLLTSILLVGCGKSKINLMDESIVSVTFYGANGYGTATINKSNSSLERLLVGENANDSNFANYLKASDFISSITYSLSKEENLSNDEEITLSVSWDNDLAKKYGYKVSGKNQKIKVSDLKNAKTIDVFENISIEFAGVSGNGSATVKNKSTDPFLSSITYSVDTSYYLSNNDEITVTATFDEDNAIDAGYVIPQTEKKYTVTGLDDYLTSSRNITDEKLTPLKSQAQDLIESQIAELSDHISAQNLNYKGSYFLSSKENFSTSYHNLLYLIYSVDIEAKDNSFKNTVYIPVRYEDIIQYADGSLYVDLSEGRIESDDYIELGLFSSLPCYTDGTKMHNNIIVQNKADYDYEINNLEEFGK